VPAGSGSILNGRFSDNPAGFMGMSEKPEYEIAWEFCRCVQNSECEGVGIEAALQTFDVSRYRYVFAKFRA
jgi:hypothetical protein